MTRLERFSSVVAILALVGAACAGGDTSATQTTTSVAVATTTTQAAPPTTVAATAVEPPVEAEPFAFAEAFVAAFNERNRDSILQSFDPSATSISSLQVASGPDEFSDELSYRWALNSHWELLDCAYELSTIVCGLDVSRDDFPDASATLPAELRLDAEDGVIIRLYLVEDKQTILAMATRFYTWVEENHPGVLDQMTTPAHVPFPLLTDESIAFWVELIPQYKASLDG